MFESKVLSRIFGCKKVEEAAGPIKLFNAFIICTVPVNLLLGGVNQEGRYGLYM
jgi:hypothetical protein